MGDYPACPQSSECNHESRYEGEAAEYLRQTERRGGCEDGARRDLKVLCCWLEDGSDDWSQWMQECSAQNWKRQGDAFHLEPSA